MLLQLWPILFFFVCGYALRKTGRIPQHWPHQLNLLVIRVIFPALILLTVPSLEFTADAFFAILAPWVLILGSVLVLVPLSRWMGWSAQTRCALLVLCALGNTGFLGVPMVKLLFGLETVGYAILFDQFGTFIGLTSYATLLVAFTSGKSASALGILKEILLFPPLITLLIALALPSQILAPLEIPLSWMAKLIIPLTMLSIGLQFRFRVERELALPLAVGLGLKMFFFPMLIWLIAHYAGIAPQILTASVFQAATPPMVTGAALLMSRQIAPSLAVALLGFGTLVGFVWLPLLALFLS